MLIMWAVTVKWTLDLNWPGPGIQARSKLFACSRVGSGEFDKHIYSTKKTKQECTI